MALLGDSPNSADGTKDRTVFGPPGFGTLINEVFGNHLSVSFSPEWRQAVLLACDVRV